MEDLATFAGNLLAELYVIRDEARTGRITKEEALRRMGIIGQRAKKGREEWRAFRASHPPRLQAEEGVLHI